MEQKIITHLEELGYTAEQIETIMFWTTGLFENAEHHNYVLTASREQIDATFADALKELVN